MNATDEYPPFGQGRHLLSVSQFTRQSMGDLFTLADTVRPIARREAVCTALDGAVLGSLFFEPSTRTRLSFESAFLRLGGEVTTTTGFTFSSMAKGESIADTSRVVSGYSDVLVVRHPDEGSVAEFAAASVVPVINGGDGPGEHPSQALLDVYTMDHEMKARGKSCDGASLAILGDLKHGRTVHSLMKLMALHENVTYRLYSPPSLDLPNSIAQYVADRGHTVVHCDSVVEAVSGADIVYATRIQRERMTEELTTTETDLLNRSILREAEAEDVILMHPLPRDARPGNFDLSSDVDDLPGLSIFKQTDNGVNVRMAIFLTTLGVSNDVVRATTKHHSWNATLAD